MIGCTTRRTSLGSGRRPTLPALLCAMVAGTELITAPARADIDVGKMVEQWRLDAASPADALGDPFGALSRRGDGVLRLLVHAPDATLGPELSTVQSGMVQIQPRLFAWAATPEEVASLLDVRPDLRVTWSAPRHVLLDQAVPMVHADIAHRSFGVTGNGVVVGIVDTGLDVRHGDLRRKDGTSRIAWLLDMSHPPIGRHATLEANFGCNKDTTPCAVYSAADLDELIGNAVVGDEPTDSYGHGTHVASLAAGNGLASPVPTYIGMAPDATIVAVRATRDGGGIAEDPDILSAVSFIFKIADEELKSPAVVNLSLGGDFGAHDGTSALERGLAAFVGPDKPGHSIVVAAGNSGLLFRAVTANYPNPLGIHTNVQVPPESSVRVPLLAFASVEPRLQSQLFVWIATRSGDRLKVGFESNIGMRIAPTDIGAPLQKARDKSGDYLAYLQNGVTESDDPASIDHSGAALVIEGPFAEDQVFALRLEGHGTASIWVQPAGGIDPSLNEMGALIPAAQRDGTVGIPATSKDIIAVGAALDHVSWKDVTGTNQLVAQYIARFFRQGEVLSFSAGGPNAVDVMKPDLVAPGGWIAGAMSSLTDPRTQSGKDGMFLGTLTDCMEPSDACLVVDDQHAISTGTSMASPIVAGAVALLLERNPRLTQPEILRLLQAGASTVGTYYASPSQVGAGLLNVENSLLAMAGTSSEGEPNLEASWIGLAVSYARPDPAWPVAGHVHLRDAADHAVDLDPKRLSLEVENGAVLSELERQAPGYYRFAVAAGERTAGQNLVVLLKLDGQPKLRASREIWLDLPDIQRNTVAGRGCAVAPASPGGIGSAAAVALLCSLARGRRRRHG